MFEVHTAQRHRLIERLRIAQRTVKCFFQSHTLTTSSLEVFIAVQFTQHFICTCQGKNKVYNKAQNTT
jgi:hypothetical protein